MQETSLVRKMSIGWSGIFKHFWVAEKYYWLSHTYQLFLLISSEVKRRKGNEHYCMLLLDFQLAMSHGDIYFSFKEVLCLTLCHQNIYCMQIYRSRSRGKGVPSSQSFIMKITHVSGQKISPQICWLYNFKTRGAIGFSTSAVCYKPEAPL